MIRGDENRQLQPTLRPVASAAPQYTLKNNGAVSCMNTKESVGGGGETTHTHTQQWMDSCLPVVASEASAVFKHVRQAAAKSVTLSTFRNQV